MNTAPTEADVPEEALTPQSGSLHWTEPILIDGLPDGATALLRVADTRVFSAQRDVLHMSGSNTAHLQAFAKDRISEARAAFDRTPTNAFLARNLASAYVLGGFPNDALHVLAPFQSSHIPGISRLTARAKAELGQLDEAVQIYRQAVDSDPQNVELRLEYAGAIFNQGRLDESRTEYEKALELDPSNAWASNNLGILRATTSSDVRGAIRNFRTAVRGHDHFAVAYNHRGLCLSKVGEHAKEIGHFRTAIRLVSKYKGAFINLAQTYIKLAQYNEAEVALKSARQQFPDDDRLADLLSDVLIAQSRWKDAALVFRESLSGYGENYERLNNVGVTFVHLGKDADAEHAWRLAIHNQPTEHHAHYNLLWLLIRQKRYREADQVFHNAMPALPDSESSTSEVEAAYASSLMAESRLTEAEHLLRERVRRGNAATSVFIALNLLLGEHLGRYSEAADVIRAGLEVHPQEERFGNSLAYNLLMADAVDAADQVLQRYNRFVGINPDFTATRGLYHIKKGHLEKGVQLYRDAVALSDRDQKARVRQKLELELGRIFLRSGEVGTARHHLKRAIEIAADRLFTNQARTLLPASHA